MAGNFIGTRAGKADLDRALRRIRALSSAEYVLDKHAGGYRLELASGRSVSPRLQSLRAFVEWLHAFEAGLDQARREQEASDASGPVTDEEMVALAEADCPEDVDEIRPADRVVG